MGSLSSNSIGREGGESSRHSLSPRGSKERRRSAGDEQGMLAQLNMFVRTRTDSGKQLSDMVSIHFQCSNVGQLLNTVWTLHSPKLVLKTKTVHILHLFISGNFVSSYSS